MVLRSSRPTNGVPFCVAVLVSALVGCSSHPPDGAEKNSSASGTAPVSAGGGGTATPVLGDSTTCAQPILPAPDLDPQPVHPCTEERWDGTTQFRYDATGRVVYSARHSTYGSQSLDEVYTSEDAGDTRIETVTTNGMVTER